MLNNFFYALREAELKPSVTEYLTLLEALQARVAFCSIDEFYYLARATLVKDETKFDKFDRVFGAYFQGVEDVMGDLLNAAIPEEWLEQMKQLNLSEEELKKIQSLGGLDKLMEEFKKRLEEQKERHEGGNKWIGTGGTSPFGNGGFNPEGIRVGGKGGNRSAVKVWDKREYANLDDSLELGTRNIKIALRRLRKFARTGAEEVLDLDDTIRSTARNAGYLDIKMVPERHNAVKVLLFFDVGGSMDPHVRVCEELFSAASSEFKHMEYFYFHNFIYENVWKDNHRRHNEKTSTWDLIHRFGEDYKVIFVGDATMSPYEITYPGGSVEHWNEEAGSTWMQRITSHFNKVIWLNPEPEQHWDYHPSIQVARELVEERMFPMTLNGLERGMKQLL
ncbi:VWA containing CoxE family protein [Oceanococcus atlanticus]|uniref:VWA containing CoxE family protein n=1 Tax=Oceanococcus atlanticus TaxID=1317117 RepID=A0A1Y1SA88_9GAMM|nr:VWA domain-containing protein [Oceanococcus atlanticus]ORE85189.1 VWA containing CoxE family protein [Oceanococcus atlanticus]RZO83929.1 MAG: VWA domain-containing protein [Oceanococcus sp.]